jgi:hypothetical protein
MSKPPYRIPIREFIIAIEMGLGSGLTGDRSEDVALDPTVLGIPDGAREYFSHTRFETRLCQETIHNGTLGGLGFRIVVLEYAEAN